MDFSNFNGIIVALAYPEEFVSMIPGWYRKPMEWLGMVNQGKIAAGHSAMMLINKDTGEIHYADFGRYISPLGYGRTRTKITDPEVAFDFKVEIDAKGRIINREELLQHIYDHPEKTHGGNVMYASINEAIDYEAARMFIDDMNAKGSIKYDPFQEDASNCSRFVYDSILAGMTDNQSKKRLRNKSIVTPSPLGNVFHGTDGDTYLIRDGELSIFNKKGILTVVKHLFKKYKGDNHFSTDFVASPDMHLLSGVGDQSYFKLTDFSQIEEGFIKASRTNLHGSMIFNHWFTLLADTFDHNQSYQLIHDCNAQWFTIRQDQQEIRMERHAS